MSNHVADAEAEFLIVNVTPDFCVVNGNVVPYDIFQRLPAEKSEYSPDVISRSQKTLKVGSVVAGTIGNAGAGVLSGVAAGSGHAVMMEGDPTVLVDGSPVVHHGHLCLMNVSL